MKEKHDIMLLVGSKKEVLSILT